MDAIQEQIRNQTNVCTECVDENCCECWKEGCGLDPVWGGCADCLECINPILGKVASAVWCLGSPLAFPLIFCFPTGPSSNDGWKLAMMRAPLVRPCTCCAMTLCTPCGQFYLRKRVLNNDMTRYKLWQGHHDGPHCLAATRCAGDNPHVPITIQAGTYGESNCPNIFLALEVTVLGCFCSPCCSFDVSRQLIKEERNLPDDPDEVRLQNCQSFFGNILHQVSTIACCCCVTSCLCRCCAPDSEGAQDLSNQAGRMSNSCWSLAQTLWRGLWSVKLIAIGCMSAQMLHEMDHDDDNTKQMAKKGMPFLLQNQNQNNMRQLQSTMTSQRMLDGDRMNNKDDVFHDEYNPAYLQGRDLGGAPIQSRGGVETLTMPFTAPALAPQMESMDRGAPLPPIEEKVGKAEKVEKAKKKKKKKNKAEKRTSKASIQSGSSDTLLVSNKSSRKLKVNDNGEQAADPSSPPKDTEKPKKLKKKKNSSRELTTELEQKVSSKPSNLVGADGDNLKQKSPSRSGEKKLKKKASSKSHLTTGNNNDVGEGKKKKRSHKSSSKTDKVTKTAMYDPNAPSNRLIGSNQEAVTLTRRSSKEIL